MLAFMGTTIVTDVCLHSSSSFMNDLQLCESMRVLAAVVCAGVTLQLAHSRVAGGHHTHAQVWVGFAVGTALGMFWSQSSAFPAPALDSTVFGGGYRPVKAVCLVLLVFGALAVKWLPAQSHSRFAVKSRRQ